MKFRISLVVIALAVAPALTGCGGDDEPAGKEQDKVGDGWSVAQDTGPSAPQDAGGEETEEDADDPPPQDTRPPLPDAEPPPPDTPPVEDTTPDVHDPSYRSFLSAAKSFLKQSKASGAAISIVENGKVTLAKGLGSKQDFQRDPTDAKTLFATRGFSRTVLSLAVLSAQGDGKLDISKPVTDYAPYFDANPTKWAKQITTRHLLSHTSGYPNWINYQGYSGDVRKPGSLAGIFKERTGVEMFTKPGTLHNYANDGYALAALVLQETAGRPYRKVVADRVFSAAGMQSATYQPSGNNNRALGIFNHPDGRQDSFDPGIRTDVPLTAA